MTELVVGADVEAAALVVLRPLGVPVATAFPRTRPASWIVVSLVEPGGVRDHVLGDAAFLVECFGPSSAASTRLASEASALLRAAAWPIPVGRVETAWPVNYPDSRTEASRHQFVASITTYMEVRDT